MTLNIPHSIRAFIHLVVRLTLLGIFIGGNIYYLLLLFHISCYFISVVICVVCVLSGCKCVLPPGDNPVAVNKYYYYYYY
jgi:hypothetical protein